MAAGFLDAEKTLREPVVIRSLVARRHPEADRPDAGPRSECGAFLHHRSEIVNCVCDSLSDVRTRPYVPSNDDPSEVREGDDGQPILALPNRRVRRVLSNGFRSSRSVAAREPGHET